MAGWTGRVAVPPGTAVVDAAAAAGTAIVIATAAWLAPTPPPLALGAVLAAAAIAAAARLVVDRRHEGGSVELGYRYSWLVGAYLSLIAIAFLIGEPAYITFGFAAAVTLSSVGHTRQQQLPLHLLGIGGLALAVTIAPSSLDGADRFLVVALVAILAYLVTTLAEPLWARRSRDLSYREVVRSRNRLLAAVGGAVDLDADSALGAVVDAVVELGFDIANVAVIRDGVRYPVATRGLPGPIPPAPADAGIAGRVLRSGGPVVVDDYRRDPDRLEARDGVRAAAATPIRRDGRVVGALIGARRQPGAIDPAAVSLLEILAEHAGHALENAERFTAQQQVVEQMRRLDQLKRDFVANVSHELRTPLTVVKGLGQTLTQRGADLDDARREALLSRLNANADRLAVMLTGLLDFSRADAAARVHEPRPVELGGLVAGVVSRLEPLLAGREVAIDVAEVVVTADPPMLEHVIENLVANASKHTPEGTPVRITVRVVSGGGEVVVTDRGEGIAPDDLPFITQRYFRGRDAEEQSEGTGVGLSLVADVLEAHGSELRVRSSPGEGTSFSFVLASPKAPA